MRWMVSLTLFASSRSTAPRDDTIQLTGEFANNTLVVTTKLVESPGPPARTVPRNSTAPSSASTHTVLSALFALSFATACLLLA
jgi:hypothetical protein